jgi:predicted DNA-binding protein (UPF0278 family)
MGKQHFNIVCSYISMNMETSLKSKGVVREGNWKNAILRLADKCSNEPDINKKINLLYKINSVLPRPYQVNIPSLITDDYIDTALYRIHKNIQAGSTAAV